MQEGVYGERWWAFQTTFNYTEKGGNMLKRKSSVSIVPKVLWVFDMRISRFSVKPRSLGHGEETLWVQLLS